MTSYDLCVVGGGPGGLAAAIRGAQRGARVCLVDPGPLGGTCLNRGCIPSRSMGTTARLAGQLRRAESFGIKVSEFQVDLPGVLARKEKILRRIRTSLVAVLSRSQVTWLQGRATLQGPQEVEVQPADGPATGIQAKKIVLATGSRPASIPGVQVDGKGIITSDEILDLDQLPASLVVIGAGVIGCEFASYFSDLGSAVTLIEVADRVLPAEDKMIAEVFQRSLQKRGVTVRTAAKVQRVVAAARGGPTGIPFGHRTTAGEPEAGAEGVKVTLVDGSTLSAEKVLVSTGRTPQLPDGAAALGLKLDRGRVIVDEFLKTNLDSIYAIGDLLGEYQLASTASYEGAIVAENALGGSRGVDYTAVPETIYTEPEIASVGLTEEEAAKSGREVQVSRVNFLGLARAQTLEETEGFVQIVSDRAEGWILGVQMIGPRATDLIAEATLAIQKELSLKDLVETLHAHPTLYESLWEAAAIPLGESIYYAPSR